MSISILTCDASNRIILRIKVIVRCITELTAAIPIDERTNCTENCQTQYNFQGRYAKKTTNVTTEELMFS